MEEHDGKVEGKADEFEKRMRTDEQDGQVRRPLLSNKKQVELSQVSCGPWCRELSAQLVGNDPSKGPQTGILIRFLLIVLDFHIFSSIVF